MRLCAKQTGSASRLAHAQAEMSKFTALHNVLSLYATHYIKTARFDPHVYKIFVYLMDENISKYLEEHFKMTVKQPNLS